MITVLLYLAFNTHLIMAILVKHFFKFLLKQEKELL